MRNEEEGRETRSGSTCSRGSEGSLPPVKKENVLS